MIEWVAAALCVLGGIVALEAKQLMRGVLGLATFFLGIAILFGLQGAWFLAIGQLFLFVGGVVTLLALAFNAVPPPSVPPPMRGGWLLALAVGVLLAYAFRGVGAAPGLPTDELARGFFTTYGWALHAGLLLLFSAVIGAQYLLEDDA